VLLAGYLPFDENTMVALFQKIKNADFEYPDWFSEEGERVCTLRPCLCCVGVCIRCVDRLAAKFTRFGLV
jgi:hypothetical protein